LGVAAALLVFNLLWLRAGDRAIWRSRERRRGGAPGVIAYPSVLLLAVLLFRNRLELAAMVWTLLAFGDGSAALIGRRLPLAALPWNPRKSWGGTAGYCLFGWVTGVAAILWTAHGRFEPSTVAFAAGLGSLAGAAVESLPGSLDDNWTAPLLGTGVTALFLASPGSVSAVRFAGWLLGSALLAAVAARCGRLSSDGAIAAALVGGSLGAGLGWGGWAVLVLFFAGAVLATRPATAGGEGGRRADQVLANGGVAALAALLAAATGEEGLRLASLAALIAAAADTLSGEIGLRLAAPARLITTWRRVPPGTDGAVSWAGSAVGCLVAALLAASAAACGALTPGAAVVVALAALAGTGLDSLLGATLERSGRLDNQGVNLVSTASAALIAGCWTTA
jgi:uncharacterized protein (TIGR00297 family)